MKSKIYFGMVLSLGVLSLASIAQSGDVVPSTLMIYQSTTWTKPTSYAVVLQKNHAELYYCPNHAAFNGDAANPAQILAFFNTSCPNNITTDNYSNPSDTGFATKVYLPTGASTPSQLVINQAWANTSDPTNFNSSLQFFTIDLNASANPSTSVMLIQGVGGNFQAADNLKMNNYNQTFTFVGSSPIDFRVINN